MSKVSTIYTCSKCDAQSLKWSGRCLECGTWGTLKQEVLDGVTVAKKANENIAPVELVDFEKIESQDSLHRIKTNFPEIDRVLGGGIVPGSLVLLSGEPGIGKSTILAQIADAVGKNGQKDGASVIYVSGEESAIQVKNRLERLNCNLKNIKFLSETNVEKILSSVAGFKASLVIIDSIQTAYSRDVENEAGSIPQIRACTVKFLEVAKRDNLSFMLVGHITKDGIVAGPKTLEHIVDTVLYLESSKSNDYRMLRATKNRFGSVNELGIFEMTSAGFVEIKNPSSIFIDTNSQKITGSVISCIMEGTKPFLVEIQALVTKTVFGYPQRKASGFDLNRLQVLVAVLTKRGQINLSNQDVVLNIIGGLRINDPALDLAVCSAIASSLTDKCIDKKTIVLGEVGLGGEARNVAKLKERLQEAKKLGFDKAMIPDVGVGDLKGIEIKKIKNIKDIGF